MRAPPAGQLGGRRTAWRGASRPARCLLTSPSPAALRLRLAVSPRGWSLTVPGVSGVTGSALRETSCINRSLAALADVLRALWERRGHVPYRNSKLTHVLQDALGD